MKKVLITGHTGFVGKALYKSFLGNPDFEVSGVSKSSSGVDLTTSESLARLPKADVVVHLAGSVGVPLGWQDPERVYRSNFLSTLAVLEYCRQHSSNLIYLSSYMYGRPESLPISESHRLQCLSPYARSKRFGEILCEGYWEDFGVSTCIVRPFNIYGVGEPDTTIIGSLIKQLKISDSIEVQSLDTKRDFLFLGDLIQLLGQLAKDPIQGLRTYNVGSGESHSTLQIVNLLEQVLGRKISVNVRGETRKNEIADCYSDNSRLKRELGFATPTSLLEGLRILTNSKLN